MGLRYYQQDALTASRERFDAGITKQIIQLPTGCGKTPLLANVPTAYGFKGSARMLVIAHREELLQQAADKIRRWNPGITVGIERAESRAGNADVVVASIQTIGRKGSPRLAALNPEEFAAVVVDEAHRAVADSYLSVFEHFGFFTEGTVRLLLGVTATPSRSDGQALAKVFDEVVYSFPIRRAIEEGWLVDVRAVRVTTDTSLDGVSVQGGDFALSELAHEVDNPVRNALIVKSYIDYAQRRQAIVFGVNVAHSKHVALAFQKNGVPAEAIWGDDPDRSAKLIRFKNCTTNVLVNCQLLTEGFDEWKIGAVINAAPTKSSLVFTQRAGRGLRIPDGINNLVEARKQGIKIEKSDCLFIDVVDSTSKHSLVTLPTLLGLNKDLDLKGKSALEAVKKIEEIQVDKPNVNFDGLRDINELKTYVEQVSLFEFKQPAELDGLTELRWFQVSNGDFVLKLPGRGEKIVVSGNVIGQFTVAGQVNENVFKQDKFADIQSAIVFAETMFRTFGDFKLFRMMKSKLKTGGDKATPEQKRRLAKFYPGKVFPSTMTKQQASDAISNFIAGRWR